MKRFILIVLSILLTSTLVFGESLNLKATWTPNTEADVAGYNLYRTDGTRLKINTTLIPHPPVLPYLFSTTVPDNSELTLKFRLTAVDTSGNESLDLGSEEGIYPFDHKAPAAPVGAPAISKQ